MTRLERLKSQSLVWIIVVALLMMVVLSFASPFFLTTGNMTNLMKQVSIVAILAAGQAVVIISGGIDLSVGSILALSAVTIGWLIEHGVDPNLAILAGITMGTFAGWINGMVITRGKIPPFIATLGMLGIARGMALVITKGVSFQVLEPVFLYIGNSKVLGLPVPLYFVIVVFAAVMVVMHTTVFGRHVYAIGGDERVARLEGIPVDRQKVKIYTLSGFLAAGSGGGCAGGMSRGNAAKRGAGDRASGDRGSYHRRRQLCRWTRDGADSVRRRVHHGDDHQRSQHPRHFVLLPASADRDRHHRGRLARQFEIREKIEAHDQHR